MLLRVLLLIPLMMCDCMSRPSESAAVMSLKRAKHITGTPTTLDILSTLQEQQKNLPETDQVEEFSANDPLDSNMSSNAPTDLVHKTRAQNLATNREKHRALLRNDSLRITRRISNNSKNKVTKELRDFWKKLDQRKTNDTLQLSEVKNDNSVTNKNDHLNNQTEQRRDTTGDSHLQDEFPYLFMDNNYDYYYYYDFATELGETNPTNYSQDNVSTTEGVTTPISIEAENNNDDSLILQTTMTTPEQTTSFAEVSINKNLLRKPNIARGRKMPKLAAEETSRSKQFSPPTVPLTAEDSFLIKRQFENSRNDDRPRDILKEFPIFRHNENEDPNPTRIKKLALHEIIHNRYSTTASNRDVGSIASDTDANTFASSTGVIIVASSTESSSTLTSTDDDSISSSTDSSFVSSTTNESSSLSSLNSSSNSSGADLSDATVENVLVSPIFNDTIVNHSSSPNKGDTETHFGNNTQLNSKVTAVPNKNTNLTSSAVSFGVQKEITFSTSETQKVGKTSSTVPIVDPIFESQLGMTPMGEAPFGSDPFGLAPMGESPFGIAPSGIAPLGVIPTPESPSSSLPENENNGRYHVQVVSPDGSINGDYVVVDPVTGDVNGVRYEVAQDVDPLLVQKALLNFLALDPRFSPEPTEANHLAATTEIISPTTYQSISEALTEIEQIEMTTTNPSSLTDLDFMSTSKPSRPPDSSSTMLSDS